MNKTLVDLAFVLLDNPNGMHVDAYRKLEKLLIEDGGDLGKELVETAIIAKGQVFVPEIWAEDNRERFE